MAGKTNARTAAMTPDRDGFAIYKLTPSRTRSAPTSRRSHVATVSMHGGEHGPIETAMSLIGRDLEDSINMETTSMVDSYEFAIPGANGPLTIKIETDVKTDGR